MTTMNTDERSWYEVTKFYKGGRSVFQIAIPKGVRLTKGERETLLEWLGDNTNGGHNYGYTINTRRLRRKSPSLRVVRYPSEMCEKLMDFGEIVVTQQRMI